MAVFLAFCFSWWWLVVPSGCWLALGGLRFGPVLPSLQSGRVESGEKKETARAQGQRQLLLPIGGEGVSLAPTFCRDSQLGNKWNRLGASSTNALPQRCSRSCREEDLTGLTGQRLASDLQDVAGHQMASCCGTPAASRDSMGPSHGAGLAVGGLPRIACLEKGAWFLHAIYLHGYPGACAPTRNLRHIQRECSLFLSLLLLSLLCYSVHAITPSVPRTRSSTMCQLSWAPEPAGRL